MNLHQALLKVKESHDSTGICRNVGRVFLSESDDKFFMHQRMVCELAKGWPEYSGNWHYPVPCEGKTAEAAYLTLPLWEGEYGAARLRLLCYLIDVTKDENQTRTPCHDGLRNPAA